MNLILSFNKENALQASAIAVTIAYKSGLANEMMVARCNDIIPMKKKAPG